MEFTIGTIEDGRAWIGRESRRFEALFPVSAAVVYDLAQAVRDPNPLYWDEEYAARTPAGDPVAPPTSMWIWCLPPEWRPQGMDFAEQPPYIAQVPLPGDAVVVVETEQEYARPIHIGDRLSFTQKILTIEPKTTRLGEGCFVTSESTYVNQDGEVVGYNRPTYFRYSRRGAAGEV